MLVLRKSLSKDIEIFLFQVKYYQETSISRISDLSIAEVVFISF